MRLKLRLLDYGYILLDFENYYEDVFLAGDDDDDDGFEGIDDDDIEEI